MDKQNEIVLYQPNELTKLEVRVENDTVWLSQEQMATLFQRDRSVITKHIRNIYTEQELSQDITCAKFAHMGTEGDQQYETTLYSLDVIISVGYRVKSVAGTRFRQWANRILKDYMLRGYVVNQRLLALEEKVDRGFAQQGRILAEHQDKIDFFVRTSLPPMEGIFYNGQIFDAYVFASDLVKSATKSIVLIDNYIDETVFTLLDKRAQGVQATIYTQSMNKTTQLDIKKHNAQYRPIEVKQTKNIHDRFLIIDDTVYHIGASIKDLGKKLFAFSKMEMGKESILEHL
ncbi:MAG: virulence RhuM family protein [Paludibacteraceae bacterium]|nr:virulence RhuM family protein [Paludibacteraceae bacterium]